jgi:hypothetical protein
MISVNFLREVLTSEVVILYASVFIILGTCAGCLGIDLVLYVGVFIILAIIFVI